jgi:hypothetical protein
MKHWRSHRDWTKQNKAKLAHYFECDLDGGPHNTFEGVDEDACS